MNIERIGRYLIYQAMSLPLLWLIPIVMSFMITDYNSISQHLSELAIMKSVPPVFAGVNQIMFLAIAVSITLFAIGLMLYDKNHISFTIVLGLIYGIGMLSNSIFPMGTPLHGLYGLPIYSVIIPAVFALEYGNKLNSNIFIKISIITTILNLVYLWANAVGLDPSGYRGLTQRLAIYVINLWYFFAAFTIYKKG